MAANLTPQGNYNWAQAFLQFCKGFALQDISDSLGIPLKSLKSRIASEQWAALKTEAQAQLPARINEAPSAVELKAKSEVLKRNRDANYAIACELREDLVDAIEKLRSGKKLKQYFFSSKSGVVTEHDVDWSVKDRLLLAQYAKLIAEIGYQALGDSTWTGKADGTNGPVNSQTVPRITVVLPGLIQRPREERTAASDHPDAGPVIDIDPNPKPEEPPKE